MALSAHAIGRASERLAAAGEDPSLVLRQAEQVARAYPSTSVAVRMRVLPAAFGDVRGGPERQSNGDEAWAICRNGYVRTVMLRRSTQPRSPEAFGVSLVFRMEAK